MFRRLLSFNLERKFTTTALSGFHRKYPRTHYCGQIDNSLEGKSVVLYGWAGRLRSLNPKLKFLTMRDRYGQVQLLYRGQTTLSPESISMLDQVSPESVIGIKGTVVPRPASSTTTTTATPGVDIELEEFSIINPTKNLAFIPTDKDLPKEKTRLEHRYLDLRRPELQQRLIKRASITHYLRSLLIKQDFVEVETPILFKATPEGAREFIVPTRFPGLFYALIQSPQQHKQMLMSAGFDRYFQIARCFRDEDLRSDRQPEFTQLDLEISFTTSEEIKLITQNLVMGVFGQFGQKPVRPLQHLTFSEALRKYGSDKPDTRFDLLISQHDIEGDQEMDTMIVPNGNILTNKMLNNLIEEVFQITGQKPRFRRVSKDGTEADDLIFTHCRYKKLMGCSFTPMGLVRLKIAELMKSQDILNFDDAYHFLWIEDFPLFSNSPDGQLISTHHPFTAPLDQDLELMPKDPLLIRAQHYDLVLNGVELAGGSLRIHQRELQENILKLLNAPSSKFEHLLQALDAGCPPHGGIAVGLDRMMALLMDCESIRDVIAFPKSADGRDLLVKSPAKVDKETLAEYFKE